MQMARWKMMGLVGLAALLPACQSAADPAPEATAVDELPALHRDGAPGNACDAETAAGAVGEALDAALLERVLDAAGADEARALEEGSIITKEYKQGRVNVVVGEDGRVVEVYCG